MVLKKVWLRSWFTRPFTITNSARKQEESIEPNSMAAKNEKKYDPSDFVREERERIDKIRDLLDAKDYNTALKGLLADTDGDLHYFNRVKSEMMSQEHDHAFRNRHGKLKCSMEEPELDNERVCLWQGQSERGFPLRCHNKSINHPHETMSNHLGVICPRPLDFCAYHVRYCIETINHGDLPIKIRVPNEHALCNECYVLKTAVRPPMLNRIPGTRRKR